MCVKCNGLATSVGESGYVAVCCESSGYEDADGFRVGDCVSKAFAESFEVIDKNIKSCLSSNTSFMTLGTLRDVEGANCFDRNYS